MMYLFLNRTITLNGKYTCNNKNRARIEFDSERERVKRGREEEEENGAS